MSDSVGKKFEAKFREDFSKLKDSFVYRLVDVQAGYNGINNICDFICYHYPTIFCIECKTHKGASFPFDCFVQYERLLPFVGIPGVRCGAVVWLYEKDEIFYLPVSTVTKMKEDGKKSVSIKDLDTYNIKRIPSVKKRTFFDSDYSILYSLVDGE